MRDAEIKRTLRTPRSKADVVISIEAIVMAISDPSEERKAVIVRGLDQFGNEFIEELMIPTNVDVVTMNNLFYDKENK